VQALRIDGTHLEAAFGDKVRIPLPLLCPERGGALADDVEDASVHVGPRELQVGQNVVSQHAEAGAELKQQEGRLAHTASRAAARVPESGGALGDHRAEDRAQRDGEGREVCRRSVAEPDAAVRIISPVWMVE
jgi:hypothetical protein